jgi:hypothetical protein
MVLNTINLFILGEPGSICSIVFREVESIIYKDDEEPFLEDTKIICTPISFNIPPPRSIYEGNLNSTSLNIVMCVRTAHIIFYDIMYCSKSSIRDKKIWIRKNLQKDYYFNLNQTYHISLYINEIVKCKINKIYDATILE